MKVDEINLNQLVEIEYVIGPDNIEYLPSRVEGKTDKFFYLAVPIRKGELVPFRIGSKLRVAFSTKDNTYAFNSVVTNRHREPIPVLIVTKPEELIKIQRRSYFRLPVNLEVIFNILPDMMEYKGMTLDISGGGILLLTKTDLRAGQKLNLSINLPGRNAIHCEAKVVRILQKARTASEDNKVAINFSEINEAKRDKIFAYIFEKQREWIQKGIIE